MSSVIGALLLSAIRGICTKWRDFQQAFVQTALASNLKHTKKSTLYQLLSDSVGVKQWKCSNGTLKLMQRYPEYQQSGWPPVILALNFACHTRRRIYSDLYRLWNKLSGSRWSAGWLLASVSECVSLVTMRFSESVWTCLPLCLISLPANNLHLGLGVLSVKLWLLFVTSWHLLSFSLCSAQTHYQPTMHPIVSSLKDFVKRLDTVTPFSYLHVHSHTHTVQT